MIPLLRAFHEHAVKRGEGLRTEFFRHLSVPVTGNPADFDAGEKLPRADNDHAARKKIESRRAAP